LKLTSFVLALTGSRGLPGRGSLLLSRRRSAALSSTAAVVVASGAVVGLFGGAELFLDAVPAVAGVLCRRRARFFGNGGPVRDLWRGWLVWERVWYWGSE